MKKSPKSHSFDPQIAMEVGAEAAIVLNHFHYWIEHNRIAGTAYENGMTWTYQSLPTMQKYLPYLSIKSLRIAIDKLVEAGYIIRSKFNKNKFDHTHWYTIPQDSVDEEVDSNKEYDVPKTADRHLPIGHISVPERALPSIYSKDSKEDKKEIQPSAEIEILSFGSHVKLKKVEHEELVKTHGEKLIAKTIETVNDYCAAHGKSYKSYAAAIRTFLKNQKPVAGISPAAVDNDISEEQLFINKQQVKEFRKKYWNNVDVRREIDDDVEFVKIKNDKIYFKDPKFKELFEHNCRKYFNLQ